MKKRVNSLFVLALAGMLSLTSCGENKNEKDNASAPMEHEMHEEDTGKDLDKNMNHQDDNMMDHSSNDMGKAEFKNEESKKVYESYLEVKNALVATDAEAAKKAAASLESAVGEQEDIAGIAQRLTNTDDINQQREIFSELTAAMEPVLKGAISSGKIYKQFCPMAFEGKGDFWYSNSEEIRNPYFGDKMLKCGRVDETIK
ncbi:MAG: DUF3347 domain-containing protein [Christiangramia sp.]